MGTPSAPKPVAAQDQSVRGKLSYRAPVYTPFIEGASAASGSFAPTRNNAPPSNPVIAAPAAPIPPPAPAPIQDPAVEITPDRTPVAEVAAPEEPKALFKYESRKVGPQMTGAVRQARTGKSA
jgi:hypothetical protein